MGDAETLVFVERPYHRRWMIAWVGQRDVPGQGSLPWRVGRNWRFSAGSAI
jgi:hypothetical protein